MLAADTAKLKQGLGCHHDPEEDLATQKKIYKTMTSSKAMTASDASGRQQPHRAADIFGDVRQVWMKGCRPLAAARAKTSGSA